jgi:hypothetical protein
MRVSEGFSKKGHGCVTLKNSDLASVSLNKGEPTARIDTGLVSRLNSVYYNLFVGMGYKK